MKTLVYVGANVGMSLWHIFQEYDQVYVFEPDPEMFEQLKRKYKQFEWVTLINAAGSLEDGKATFYITNNRVASSLGNCPEDKKDYHEYRNASVVREITVNTVNIGEYLKSEGVEFIDLYYSDCQGSDLNVLKTLKEYVDQKKIGEMFIETHSDGVYLYDKLNNQFSGFKELLSDNYDFVHASLGGRGGIIVGEDNLIPGDEEKEKYPTEEWDSYWRLKGYPASVGSMLRA